MIAWLCILGIRSIAQAPASFSSADILQGLNRLNVLGSVLYIAAHPDDENTRLLAYQPMKNTGQGT